VKIKFLSGPRSGQIDHAPNSQEIQLLAKAGIIEIIPYKNYVERLSSEFREASGPGNTPVAMTKDVEWSCSRLNDRPIIFRKSGFETARIETIEQAIQCGCPESVLRQFRAYDEVLTGIAASGETVAQEQYRAAARETADNAGVWKQLFSRV
jgi:hypothetical protein